MGWSAITFNTCRRYASGSIPFNLQVPIRVYISAAYSPPSIRPHKKIILAATQCILSEIVVYFRPTVTAVKIQYRPMIHQMSDLSYTSGWFLPSFSVIHPRSMVLSPYAGDRIFHCWRLSVPDSSERLSPQSICSSLIVPVAIIKMSSKNVT